MDGQFPMALPENTILAGQYIVEEVVGQGEFGFTYLVSEYKTDKLFVIREFFPGKLAKQEGSIVRPYADERSTRFRFGKSSFLQEAETLARLAGHKGIAGIHNYFEENETAYYVMDHIDGITLTEYINSQDEPIAYETAEKIFLPVMDAAALFHEQGITHGSITPDHIYMNDKGEIFLQDHAAVRYSAANDPEKPEFTTGFQAKEQCDKSEKLGAYTDVYTLAASFYFVITGVRPQAALERLTEDCLKAPSELGVEIDGVKEEALLWALEVQPNNGFWNMKAFKAAIQGGNKSAGVQPQIASESLTVQQRDIPEPMPELPQNIPAPEPIVVPKNMIQPKPYQW